MLERYGVRLLGTPLETIKKAEDRELFKQLLIADRRAGAGQRDRPLPSTRPWRSRAADRLLRWSSGRPTRWAAPAAASRTRRGELRRVAASGLAASPVSQVLVEQSLVGWKEIEYEVMRDGADTCITVCNMENFDPMGVHTGDSIVVAPSQTLSDHEYQMLRTAALKIIRALGIEGGCNVQFALDPKSRQYYVIEVNPRVSRSSALASKATGYPIARVAAKIAVGKRLDEIPNAVTGKTTAAFEPALDYWWSRSRAGRSTSSRTGDRTIGTQMKATGEVMAIDRSFEAALQKAVRSLEIGGRSLLWEEHAWSEAPSELDRDLAADRDAERPAALGADGGATPRRQDRDEIAERAPASTPGSSTSWTVWSAMERGCSPSALTPEPAARGQAPGLLRRPDRHAGRLDLPEQVRDPRHEWGLRPVYKMVDTCAAEFEAVTPYFYSTYEQENEAAPLRAKAVVLGSGPIRIGQGIEFDYCSVHAAWALERPGYAGIMVNSNPETVSHRLRHLDRLYFEPLDEESVRDILENETQRRHGRRRRLDRPVRRPDGDQPGRAARPRWRHIIGTGVETIDLAEDRARVRGPARPSRHPPAARRGGHARSTRR